MAGYLIKITLSSASFKKLHQVQKQVRPHAMGAGSRNEAREYPAAR